jgi:hypothetical protein
MKKFFNVKNVVIVCTAVAGAFGAALGIKKYRDSKALDNAFPQEENSEDEFESEE